MCIHQKALRFRMQFKQLKLANVSENTPENRNAVQRYKCLKWSWRLKKRLCYFPQCAAHIRKSQTIINKRI